MKSQRLDYFIEQCEKCAHNFCLDKKCDKSCPVYFKPIGKAFPRNKCHCVVKVTTEERKTGKCKFFKEAKKQMKVKVGDITIRQRDILCSKNEECYTCPLHIQIGKELYFDCNSDPCMRKDYDREIELPEEVESKMRAFDKIKNGLNEAIAYEKGESK